MITKIEKLNCIEQVKKQCSLDAQAELIKSANDTLVKQLISGVDNRFIVIAGPCGIDDYQPAVEYCNKLAALSKKYEDKIAVVCRLFTAKPRSNGDGYKGRLFQEYNSAIDINSGIAFCRRLFVDIINQTHLPIADELLYPDLSQYMTDLISYFIIGARSSLNPIQRNVASGLDVAVGVKNGIYSSVKSLSQSVYAASNPKKFSFNGYIVETSGNEYCNGILRGTSDMSDNFVINYTGEDINNFYLHSNSVNRIIIDCSHANSGKVSSNQSAVAINAACNYVYDKRIGGIMLESYLNSGHSDKAYGVSRIDECISIEETAEIFEKIYLQIK